MRGLGLSTGTEDDLPKSIIVTNVEQSVFDNPQLKVTKMYIVWWSDVFKTPDYYLWKHISTIYLLQAHFERMFRDFEVGAAFHYLPSFRRIRVDFASHLSASKAKQHMESTIIGENTIHCYFIQVSIVSFCKCSRMLYYLKEIFCKVWKKLYRIWQVLSPCTDQEAFLDVPPLEKQFLISPPCSPPVGWEQPKEDKPVVDYDLLAAMAQLSPGT